MAFFPRRRPPVPFGYPLVGLAAPGYPVDYQRTAWSSRFRLDSPLPHTLVAADGSAITADDQKAVVPSGVHGGGAGSATQSGASQDTDAESSSVAKESGRSDKSECSSLAPYWIPEEIKHYFLHRRSECDEDDSSRKVDLGLRAIGRERELPAIDDGNWSHYWLPPYKPSIGSPFWDLDCGNQALKAKTLWGAHIANENGDDLQPSVDNEEHLRDADILEAPHAADSRSKNVKEEDTVGDSDEGTVNHRTVKARSGTVGSLGSGGSSRIWMKALCGQPAFRFCSGGPPEFYYNASGQACVESSPRGTGLCNRGRNRFTSLESCRTQCVDRETPAPKCYRKAVLAECQA
ncbi:hypothetical protein MTO96_037025 [Rhipicephalus appendiculatus]